MAKVGSEALGSSLYLVVKRPEQPEIRIYKNKKGTQHFIIPHSGELDDSDLDDVFGGNLTEPMINHPEIDHVMEILMNVEF